MQCVCVCVCGFFSDTLLVCKDAARGQNGADVARMEPVRSCCTSSLKLKLLHSGSDKDKDYLLTIIFNL